MRFALLSSCALLDAAIVLDRAESGYHWFPHERTPLHPLIPTQESSATRPPRSPYDRRAVAVCLKDGLDYTEWLVEQVDRGLAELDSGQEMSWADLEAEIAKRRAARAGKRKQAA